MASPRLAIQVGANLGAAAVADLGWVEIHRSTSTPPPPPPPPVTLTSVSPASGRQGQVVTATLIGTGFVAGTTCSFGAGVTVAACTVTTPTEMRATLVIAPGAAVGPRTVSVTTPGAQTASLANSLTVGRASLVHFDFAHADAAALKGSGWSFVARTAGGGTRNTEQTGSLAISYDQVAHPGAIRVPLGSGEIWKTLNNSQNTLFRNLPTDWTSLRLRVAAFAPVANAQQVALMAY
jgi:hypothetical protein